MEDTSKVKKSQLRAVAPLVLERRGVPVSVISGQGILPGARLLAADDHVIAVRVSLDREIGLTRHPDGTWFTLPNVDEVLVCVPAENEPHAVEVHSFDPEVLISAFDRAVASKNSTKRAFKTPVFVGLDAPKGGTSPAGSLKSKAQWCEVVSLSELPVVRHHGPIDAFRAQLAELNGVDIADIQIEVTILRRQNSPGD